MGCLLSKTLPGQGPGPAGVTVVGKALVPADTASVAQIGGGPSGPGDPQFIKWVSEKRVALPEHRAAASTICVQPELMAESRTAAAVSALLSASSDAGPPGSIDTVAVAAIRRAWPARAASNAAARSLHVEVPGLANGCAFAGTRTTHNALERWQQDLLRRGLALLASRDGDAASDEICIVIGMLMRGAQECQSRKTWAFYAVLTRCAPPSAPADGGQGLASARARVMAGCREFLEDEKDAAFRTHFIEPSWLYLAAVHDGNPDVVVHGANTYLAVLAATLGVRMSREPFLEDESKGVAPFLDFQFSNGALSALHHPSNLGKSWEAVRECRNPRCPGAPRMSHRWITDGGSPMTSVKLATGSKRAKAAPYLEGFAQPFAAHRLLPRLVSRLTQSDSMTAALNAQLLALQSAGLRVDDGEGSLEDDDVRYWLWDLEAEPEPAFRLERALLLFGELGVVKPALVPQLVPVAAQGQEQEETIAPLSRCLSRQHSAAERESSFELVRQTSEKSLSADEIQNPIHEY